MNITGRRYFSLKGILSVACFLFLAGVVLVGTGYSQKDASTPGKAASRAATTQGLPRLVDVGADKCIPCKMMAPILEELKKEYTGVLQVDFVDAWKNPNEASKYGVRGIPTQIFYDISGKERARHMGFISKEDILKGFEQLGISLKKPSKK
jgi:thioredoxin 1